MAPLGKLAVPKVSSAFGRIHDGYLIDMAVRRLLQPEVYITRSTAAVHAEAKRRGLWERVLVETAKRKLGVEPE